MDASLNELFFFLKSSNYWFYFAINFTIIITVYLSFSYFTKRESQLPPSDVGWLPWLGCAIAFGKNPLHYINASQEKFGDVFTLCMTGRRLTFLMDSDDHQIFFTSPNVNFQKAVQEPVQKTAGISIDGFYNNHTRAHDLMKGYLSTTNLLTFHTSLKVQFTKHLMEWDQRGEAELMSFVRTTMYKSVVENLFGIGTLPIDTTESYKEFEAHFKRFDDDFEYGSQLPELFLKEWSKSKRWLLNVIGNAVSKYRKTETKQQTMFHQIVDSISGADGTRFAMLFLWASLANAIPITFWTLAFLLEHQLEMEEVLKEVDSVISGATSDVEFTPELLKKLPKLKHCILEAIRLRSPGVITRKVTAPLKVKNYTIPAGDLLMISPFLSHRNGANFPDPDSYKPDRWNSELEVKGFIAFGGGRYQCPGRWFALLEIQIFLILILKNFTLTLTSDVPKPCMLHIVGTQQPDGECNVKYVRRS